MRFLANECCDAGIVTSLRASGHDVVYVPERQAGLSDDEVAQIAFLWLKDKSLADLDNLPDPDELASDIVENLDAAVESFKEIARRI